MAQRFDVRFAARVIFDATLFGHDKAAQLHGIATKTVQRYLDRRLSDPALQTAIERLQDAADAQTIKADARLAERRQRAQLAILDKIIELVPKAKLKDLPVLATAYGNVSEVDIALRMLNVPIGSDGNGGAPSTPPTTSHAGEAEGAEAVAAGDGKPER